MTFIIAFHSFIPCTSGGAVYLQEQIREGEKGVSSAHKSIIAPQREEQLPQRVSWRLMEQLLAS